MAPPNMLPPGLIFAPRNGNTIPITDLRFYAIVVGLDGEDTAVPVTDESAALTVTDFGSAALSARCTACSRRNWR